MWRHLVGVGLVAVGVAAACGGDERDPVLTDVVREPVAEARPVRPDMALLRHYEGLRNLARGRLLERQDRLTEALQAYEMALQFDPEAVELTRLCIPINFKLERTVPALQLLRQALAQDAKQGDLWLRYAQELLDLQRHDEVVRVVGQALQSADLEKSPAFRADFHVVRATALDALNRPADAAGEYRQALRIVEDRERYLEDPYSPTAEELPGEHAKLLERLARACQRAGQFEAAHEAFRRAETVQPRGDGRFELNLAEVQLGAKQPAEALRYVEECLQHKPLADEAYRLLAAALREGKRESEVLPALEKWRQEAPESTGVRVVLAEEYARAQRFAEAENLYRELITTDRVAWRGAGVGYLQLLAAQLKWKEAVEEFQRLCRTPQLASWGRSTTLGLLAEPKLFQGMLECAAGMELAPTVRLLLVKMALQARHFPAAEVLARRHAAEDPKPGEAYLLLCQALLEQRRYADVVEACRAALRHEAVTQPLTFHLEAAKALALQRLALPAQQALEAAKEAATPGTTEEHKVRCTELYVLHLLGRQDECVRLGKDLLGTDLARGPWGRQVRYLLAHAHEAAGRHEEARQLLTRILRDDPNDDEAAAALARCLLLQNQQLDQAERWARQAVELDYVARFKRNRTNPVPTTTRPNPAYQATLGAVLLRTGRSSEAVTLLTELEGQDLHADPWTWMCLGDAHLVGRQGPKAEACWKQARACAEERPVLGLDVRPSVGLRLQALRPAVSAAPASTTSPVRP